eukprot:Sdes_comp20357_c3_seq1m14141
MSNFNPKYGAKDSKKFEEQQEEALSKACSKEEVAPKPKHIRSAVITTWTHSSGHIFWECLKMLPLGTHQIMCWKALITIHELLHDGHPTVIVDSANHRADMTSLAELWASKRSEYAGLISTYIDFLNEKIAFHLQNPELAGDLNFESYQKSAYCADSELGSRLIFEIFRLQEAIDRMQKTIFRAVNSSQTVPQLECRTAALVPLVDESGDCYRIVVDIMIRLHRSMNPDLLQRHRELFNQQFFVLKRFFFDCSNLKYVNSLTQVPQLPDEPPDFLQMDPIRSPPPALPPRPKIQTPLPDLFDAKFDSLPERMVFDDYAEMEEKNKLLERLMVEISGLKRVLQEAREQHVADLVLIEQLKDRIRYLEGELEGSAEKYEEIAKLKQQIEKYSGLEEKQAKMMKMYSELRDKHLATLSNTTNLEGKSKNQIEQMKMEFDHAQLSAQEKIRELETEKNSLQSQMLEMKRATDLKSKDTSFELSKYRNDFNDLKKALEAQKVLFEAKLKKQEQEIRDEKAKLSASEHNSNLVEKQQKDMIEDAVEQAKKLIHDSISELKSNHPGNISSTTETICENISSAQERNKKLTADFMAFFSQKAAALDFSTLGNTTLFAISVQQLISNGKGLLRFTDEEKVEQDLVEALLRIAQSSLDHLEKLKSSREGGGEDEGGDGKSGKKALLLSKSSAKLKMNLDAFLKFTDELVPQQIPDQDSLGEILDHEMKAAAQAIADAGRQIEQLLEKSKRETTGVQLEVNSSILGASSELMKAIQILIEKATESQAEIVAKGKGSASASEFYKKNNRWTEGLISAAQAVGWGAGVLVETADGFVGGSRKIEQLIVASREIAASTAQLVAASRVKAERRSGAQGLLEGAASCVTDATKQLVRVAKEGAALVERRQETGGSGSGMKMGQIQAKREEMEIATKVLELETQLAKQRQKLLGFRRQHYHDEEGAENESEKK